MLVSVGSTMTRLILPVACNPLLTQVRPPLVDLYTPLPIASAGRIRKVSPVPAHTCCGSDGATARAPMDELSMLSKIGRHVMPASSVLKIPPEAAPTYAIVR